MKICFLTQTLDPETGYGRYASDIIAGIKYLEHEVVVLKEKDDGRGGYPILGRGWKIFYSAWKSRKYLRDCDIVHALDGYPYAIIAAIARIGTRAKLITSALGTYAVAPLYNKSTSGLIRWAYRSSLKIIAISTYTQKEILKKISLNNMEVINPGIDLVKFLVNHQESSEDFILSVGTIEDRKGYDVSVRAFAKIANDFPNLKYYIVGRKEDWYFEQIVEIINQEGLSERVVFFENVNDDKLRDFYMRAKLFVLAPVNIERYHFEGFGLVYLEAAAAGTPVIGSLDSGADDAVKNGFNGLLVQKGNVDALAVAMNEILSSDELWRSMSEAGHAWAKEHSIDDMVRQYEKIYKSL